MGPFYERKIRMRTLPKVAVLLGCVIVIPMACTAQKHAGNARTEQKVSDTFDPYPTGSPPPGWTTAVTGTGESIWTVETCDNAPSRPHVLKQSGQLANGSFPLCIKDDTKLKDGFVEVQFKPISGTIDQAAGVLWRYKDKDNYYICRANALENNVVLYKVEKGKRTSLEIVGRKGGYGVEEKVSPEKWNTLRVEFSGNLFAALFNGKKLFEVQDSTFVDAGKVGLWTKADTVMTFDDFRYGVGGPAKEKQPGN
jgi:hypothetical protein